MERSIHVLQGIVSRKGSSKTLTFGMPHVFKALQMLDASSFVSRADLVSNLQLGEGAVKTLIAHLKESGLIRTVRSGNQLTDQGKHVTKSIMKLIFNECKIRKCNVASGRYNHAIILKKYAKSIMSGIEQRDYAIMSGADRCVTIACQSGKFVFPGDGKDCVMEKDVADTLFDNLKPCDGDVIIISSSNDEFTSEISAKNSALQTLVAN